MFSGKSSKLIDLYQPNGEWIGIKPRQDVRSSDIASHDYRRIPSSYVDNDNLRYFRPSSVLVKHVLIDEGQFFSDLADGCLSLVNKGFDVHVAALSGTAKQEPWPSVSRLIPFANRIEHFTSKCNFCGADAPFTMLKCSATKLAENSVLIGGSDFYAPVCRHHLQTCE